MNAAALRTAEILVRFTNPAEGSKKPSIKASDGTYYGVTSKDFGRFQPGGRYRIEYTERVWQGRTYRDIRSLEPIRSDPQASGDSRPHAPSPAQRSVSAGEGVMGVDPAEAEFVSRCLAASIASCSVGRTREELVERVRMLRAVYREGMG